MDLSKNLTPATPDELREGGPEARREPRFLVEAEVLLRVTPPRRVAVRIADLSSQGCSLHGFFVGARVGQFVTVMIPSLEALTAVVRWIRGEALGLEFVRPLYGPVFEHLVRLHTPQPNSPDNQSVS